MKASVFATRSRDSFPTPMLDKVGAHTLTNQNTNQVTKRLACAYTNQSSDSNVSAGGALRGVILEGGRAGDQGGFDARSQGINCAHLLPFLLAPKVLI